MFEFYYNMGMETGVLVDFAKLQIIILLKLFWNMHSFSADEH